MIILIVSLFAIVFFIENRLASGKQDHIHYLCIILFSWSSVEMGNTLLVITLLYWAVRSVKKVRFISVKPYIIPLFILSSILLVTGFLSFLALKESRTDLLGLAVRNYIIMTIWPIMIANTIPDMLRLRKMAFFYALVRIFEVGITGMIIYFFYYKEFYIFGTLTNMDINISDYNTPRLLSIGAPNPNDAAFVLLGALGLVAYRLFYQVRILDLLLSIIALVGMLLTWTRSVWVFVLLYFVLVIGFNKKLNKFALLFTGLVLLVLSTIALQLFEERKTTDDRLQSTDNASLRKQQYTNYISSIPKMPFLWGMYDDSQIIASKLNLKEEFSSENYILETFTRNGILAGSLFTAFFVYIIIGFWYTTKTYIKVHEKNTHDVAFVVAAFATFISLFLMAQTSLFHNNLILWIMIGFLSVIKQQIYTKNNEG